MYRRRQFATAQRLLEVSGSPFNRPHHQLLRFHSAIMGNLYRNEGEGIGGGADWRAVNVAIKNAADFLRPRRDMINQADLILDRYEELGEVARLAGAVAGGNEPKNRIIDVLAGLEGTVGADRASPPCCSPPSSRH